MVPFAEAFENLERVLNGFYEHRSIDATRLGLIDPIIESAKNQQFRVLSDSVDLETQRIMFSGFRNIENIGIMFKEKLATASERHENPTTVALALDLMPQLISLSKYLDMFIDRGRGDIDKVSQFTRSVYKKSKALGFSRDTKIQLEESGITTDEIKAFIEDLSNNITLEIEEAEEINENID